MRVTKCNMIHNHISLPNPVLSVIDEPDEQDYFASEGGTDCTEAFERIFDRLSFSTFKELQFKIDEFQKVDAHVLFIQS